MRTAKRRRALTWATGIALAVAGCAPSAAGGSVPDAVLFDQVAGLDGVASADLSWDRRFGYTPQYVGTVTAEQDADAMCVLDQTMAILYQGRPDTGLREVEVVQGDRRLTASALVGSDPLSERYGHRPSEPQPTAAVPDCAADPTGVDLGGAVTPAPAPASAP
jgi:hypothetical protein